MVHGLAKFKEYFGEYAGNYVFIGGTACSILVESLGGSFRVTKDLDTVLLMEGLDPSFVKQFWAFIEAGGYQHRQKGNGREQFYRFSHPSEDDFPAMVELFSRKPEGLQLPPGAILAPIPTGESMASLSAILLNDVYYQLLLTGRTVVDGYSVLRLEFLLLFKIRAWLDLSGLVALGEIIDARDVRKHKNDVFRLLMYVDPMVKIPVDGAIMSDIDRFLQQVAEEKTDLRSLGIRSTGMNELLARLSGVYLVE
jgi:hypothetical protein